VWGSRWLCQERRLALRARRRWRGRCAPGRLLYGLRRAWSPPRATRSALGAEGALRACAPGRAAAGPGCHHRCWLPSRCALGADGVAAARPGACAAAWSAPRATRSAPVVWALCAPGRLHTLNVLLPVTCVRSTSWVTVGMSLTSCAARCSRRSVQGALRAPASFLPRARVGRGRGGVGQTS